MQKFVAVFDRHYGWEKKWVKNKFVTQPTHDQKLFNVVMSFVKDFKPDIFIDGGDGFQMSPISRHNKNKPRLIETKYPLKKEYDLGLRYQIEPMEQAVGSNCKKVMLKGNHEHWAELLVDENPQLEGLLEPYNYLKIPERGWEVVDYGDVYKVSSQLYVCHGDNLSPSAAYTAASLLKNYGKNIIAGHSHTAQMHTAKSLANEHAKVAYSVPMLGNPNFEFIRRSPSAGMQGFIYGYILPNGNFNAYTVIATNRKFVVEGKLYE